MEEGSARVTWYERLLLIGPKHFFHRLLMKGRESSESCTHHVNNLLCPYRENILKIKLGNFCLIDHHILDDDAGDDDDDASDDDNVGCCC